MSLILDALRKMEEERKLRQGGNAGIRPAMLGSSQVHGGGKSSNNHLVLAAAGVFILAAGIAGGIMLTGTQRKDVAEQARANTESEGAMMISGAATIASPATVSPSEPLKLHPVSREAMATGKAPPQPVPTPAVTPAPTPVQRPVKAEQPAPAEYPGADILVSGIAWQEERNLRRAVVNGSLVGEGAEIAGARIVEIGERRVKFFQGGRTISVSISSQLQGR